MKFAQHIVKNSANGHPEHRFQAQKRWLLPPFVFLMGQRYWPIINSAQTFDVACNRINFFIAQFFSCIAHDTIAIIGAVSFTEIA